MTYLNRNIVKADAMIDGLMLALWRQGMDTNAIAKRLRIEEHQVANELPRLREINR